MTPAEQPPAAVLLGVIQTLQAELQVQREEVARARQEAAKDRAESQREIGRLVVMVEGLTKQLDLLLRDRDEERRAELARLRDEAKAAAERAMGDPATADAAGDGPEPPPPESRAARRRRSKHGRKPIPPEVTRDTNELKPATCDQCGDKWLTVLETLVSEEWDYIRAHLRCRRTERTVCRCENCRARVTPPQPPMPFDRAACTFAMMAWLCFAKCGLFLPLDRIQRDFEDQGGRIPSSTLTRWWQQGADLLFPVAGAVRWGLLATNHIRTDGTGLLVVYPRVKGQPVKGPARAGETDADGYLLARPPSNGQILVFGDDEHAVYHFTPDKKGHHAEDFLVVGMDAEGKPIPWRGTITADALSAHDRLFDSGDRLESGCNAHGLRKFRDDADKAPLLASRALGFIGRLYVIEGEASSRQLRGAELLAHRLKRAGPVMNEFRAWIDRHIEDLLPSHPIRKAMKYYVNHWDALTRFLEDPEVEIDNNWSERALRKVALLRNNSMYVGGEEGAVRVCTLFTLINTCRLIEVDPYDYLVWALERVVPHKNNRGLVADDLTPAAYKAAQKRDAE